MENKEFYSKLGKLHGELTNESDVKNYRQADRLIFGNTLIGLRVKGLLRNLDRIQTHREEIEELKNMAIKLDMMEYPVQPQARKMKEWENDLLNVYTVAYFRELRS